MAYRDYSSPSVSVTVERQSTTTSSLLTRFIPVFIGMGMTSRDRQLSLPAITADISAYPTISFEYDISGDVSSAVFKDTTFSIKSLAVSGDTPVSLQAGTDYTVVTPAEYHDSTNTVQTTIQIVDTTKVTSTMGTFDLVVEMKNTDDSFKPRLLSQQDRYYATEILGPYTLTENNATFNNDIAIAAEIAFRTGLDSFFYLEAPRNYGEAPTTSDFTKIIDDLYYENDLYYIVPLTSDAQVIQTLSDYTISTSNPVDRREMIAFVHRDPSTLTNMKDIEELVTKIGGLSESLNNSRVCNVFGGSSVNMTISSQTFTLPSYFIAAAVACLKVLEGIGVPISQRELSVFTSINGPRFRPRDWDKLARFGVLIVFQNSSSSPIVIRHQLTTAQSDAAELQEISIVESVDAITKRLRDRLGVYAGKESITDGFMEKLDGTTTTAIEEVKALKWAQDLIQVSPWQYRVISDSSGTQVEQKRRLVTKFTVSVAYPINNLDVILFI